jgi:hypothetical protein
LNLKGSSSNQINQKIVALATEFVLLVLLTQQNTNNKNNILNNNKTNTRFVNNKQEKGPEYFSHHSE